MDEKSINQNNQGGQSNQSGQNQQRGQSTAQNQSSKPTLSWSQPVQTDTNNAGGSKPQQPKASTAPVILAQSNSSWKTGSIIVGVFALCILAVWGMVALRHGSDEAVSITGSSTESAIETTGATETATAENNTAAGSLPITVPSPQTAGMSVGVSGVIVSVPTWIVVYQNNAGSPGNALGAGLFLPGGTADSIPLLRATEPGQSYFVGESVDDGSRVFSLHGDPQVKDAQGNVLWAKFQTN